MELPLLLTGAIAGFLVAAPVGPVAALCLQRTLFDGRIVGFSTGTGAVIGDTLFAMLAIFAIAGIESFLVEHRFIIQVSGSAVLLALGLWMLLRAGTSTSIAKDDEEYDHETILHAFGSGFALTIVNPITVLAFISIFATIRVTETAVSLLGSLLLIAGVLIGSAAWWISLCCMASYVRKWLSGSDFPWLNRATGAAIMCFGIYGFLDLAMR